MKITEKDVRYVADLANLELREDELMQFVPQLDAILGYVEKLNELDTSDVEPMAQVTAYSQHPEATLRPDQVHQSLDQETALANAPDRGPGYFKVPRVIER